MSDQPGDDGVDQNGDEPCIEPVPDESEPMEGVCIQELHPNGVDMADSEDMGTYTWKIDNFGNFINCDSRYSEEFEIGGYSWRLFVFPRGNSANSSSMSVFLDCPDAEFLPQAQAPKAIFKLIAVNQLDPTQNILKDTTHTYTPRAKDWGFTSFMSLTKLEEPGWVVDDVFVLRVELEVEREDKHLYDSRKETGFVGLKNQGATCYMNSMLQTLYHIPYFRKAVYQVPTADTESASDSIPLALQKLFYLLQFSPSTVSTKDLTKSFGWGTNDAFQQHDVQEFNRVLCDKLEEKMKGTPVEKVLNELFQGHLYTFTECVNVDYKSTRTESFLDLQLDVKGCSTVYDSFDKYTEVEMMTGDNKYHAESHGLQDARRGVLFENFPPVLQLHLKRFEYDYTRDIMIKINDRYEFPDVLDLDKDDRKYLSPTARSTSSKPNVYKLHSVLVHSGGLHGGHYYAFVRPDGSKWCKFDDERVTVEDDKKAVEDQYGGEDDYTPSSGNYTAPPFKFTKYSNAYMLVYIRQSDWDRVMCRVGDEDLSEHLRARLHKEQEEKERRRQEKLQAHKFTTFNIATLHDVRQQVEHWQTNPLKGFDLVDFSTVKSFKIPRSTSFQELQEMVAEVSNIAPAHQLFWFFSYRIQGLCYRPQNVIPLSYYNEPVKNIQRYVLRSIMGEKGPRSLKHPINAIDLLVLADTPSPPVDLHEVESIDAAEVVLLFVKYYRPRDLSLELVGHVLAPVSTSMAAVRQWTLAKMQKPADFEVECYSETYCRADVSLNSIELSANLTLKEASLNRCLMLQHGEILVFQPDLPANEREELAHPDVPSFLEYICNRAIVNFRELQKPKDEGFKLELSKDNSYGAVTHALAQHLGVDNAKRIRLTRHNCFAQQPSRTPEKFNHLERLESLLYHQNASTDIVYYEVLDMPLDELERLRLLRISFHNEKTEFVSEHSVRLPRDKTVQDVFEELHRQLGPKVANRELRLLKIADSKIYDVIAPDTPLDDPKVNDIHWYLRVEVVPEDEVDTDVEDLLHVYHFKCTEDRDTGPQDLKTFGDPFLLRLADNEDMQSVKQRIQSKLGVRDEVFAQWRFAYVSNSRHDYLQGDAILTQQFKRSGSNGVHVAETAYLGLEHDDKGYSKRPRAGQLAYGSEKAITIKG